MDKIMLARSFKELFLGNLEAHGTAAGGAVRITPPWLAHLDGKTPIGIYPMVASDGQWVVRWGCVDFDVKADNHPAYDFETEKEAHEAAYTLRRVLGLLAITGWVERTRSHGRHLWVFSREWVPAATMRRGLLAACEIADAPTREVNPKSTTLNEGQLGNYVNLCFPGGVNATERLILMDDGEPYGLEAFLTEATSSRAQASEIQALAELYRAPPKATMAHVEYDEDADLNQRGRDLWEYGPDSGDRSLGMIHLAKECRISGLVPEQTLGIMHTCPWNKYAGRSDEEKRLNSIIERVYE